MHEGTEHDNVVVEEQVGVERVGKSKSLGNFSVQREKITEEIVLPNQLQDDSGRAGQVERDRGQQEGDLLFAEIKRRTKLMERTYEEVDDTITLNRQGTFDANNNTLMIHSNRID